MFAIIISTLLATCKPKEDITPTGGTLRFRGTSSYISTVRIEHIAYVDNMCVLRLSALPSTYRLTETSASGYGTVADIYCITDDFDFAVGKYEISPQVDNNLKSRLTVFPKESGDTVTHSIAGGSLTVDSVSEYLHYKFLCIMSDGDTLTGEYIGTHTLNYSVDRPVYGTLSIDTITYPLAYPTLYEWENLLSSTADYHEFVFYSADSRFTDKGVLKYGLQFNVGLTSTSGDTIKTGTYHIAHDSGQPNIAVYGHRLATTSWGTYWQLYKSGSAIGKANILADSISVKSITQTSLSMRFAITDQLGNKIQGSYSGPYKRKSDIFK